MKIISTIVALLLSVSCAHAQETVSYDFDDDDYMFNHMSLGITVGTPGAGLELAMPLTKYIHVRAGATYMPPIPFTTKLTTSRTGMGYTNQISLKGTTKSINGKLLFDFYPVPKFPLHITLGTYIGGKSIMELTTTDHMTELKSNYSFNAGHCTNDDYSEAIGPKLGDYVLLPNKDGKVDGWIETSIFRPYGGLGWGKAISEKGIDWMIEAGVIYWGETSVWCNTTDLSSSVDGATCKTKLQPTETSGNKGGIIKLATKTKLYPVISFRLGFNLF